MKNDKLIVRITAIAVIMFLIGIFIINDYWEEKVMGSEKIASAYEEREEIAFARKELKVGLAADKASEDILNPRIKEAKEDTSIEEATMEGDTVANPIEATNNTQSREVTQPAPVPSPVPKSEPISKPVPSPEEAPIEIPEEAPVQIPESEANPVEEPASDPIPEVDPEPEVEPVPEKTPEPESPEPEPISESGQD